MPTKKSNKERIAELDAKIDEIKAQKDAKIDQIKAQKRALLNREKQAERKARNHRLICIGAEVESVLGPLADADISKVGSLMREIDFKAMLDRME